MLYIKKRIGRDFGIEDTDDGVVEVHTFQEIVGIVAETPDLEIKGVKKHYEYRGGQRVIIIDSIDVWQDPASLTRRQAKSLLLHGVDIRISAGRIVGISAPGNASHTPVRVELYEFADKCGENVLFGMDRSKDKPLVLVLRDGMTIRRNSFAGCWDVGTKIDISGVTDEKLVAAVYGTRAYKDSSGLDFKSFQKFVIDDPKRTDLYMAIWLVEKSGPRKVYLEERLFSDFNLVSRVVADRYREQVRAICDSPIECLAYGAMDIETLQKAYDYYHVDIPRAVAEEVPHVLKVLKAGATCGVKGFLLFWRCYMYFARYDSEYQTLMTDYLAKVRRWYLQNCHKWC